jgi:7,8-dihydro-6-hydroxymethylpterin dimethyltransferase
VGRFWQRSQKDENFYCTEPKELDLTDMEQFATRVKSHGFTITAMAFQDAATLDIARLRQCSLHVFEDGRHVPFCAITNLT